MHRFAPGLARPRMIRRRTCCPYYRAEKLLRCYPGITAAAPRWPRRSFHARNGGRIAAWSRARSTRERDTASLRGCGCSMAGWRVWAVATLALVHAGTRYLPPPKQHLPPRINQAQLVEKRHRRIPGPVPARSRSREPAGRSRRKPPAVSPLVAAAPRSDDRRCARNPAGHDPEVRINLGRRAERSDYRPPSIGQAPNRRGLGTVEQDGLRMEFLVASPSTWNNSCCGEPIVQVHHVGRLLVLPCLRSDTVAIWPALFEALEGSMSMGTGRGSFCAEISLAGNLYAAGFRWAGYRIASGRRFSCPPCLMGQSATSTGPMPWRAAPSRDPERIEAINRLLDSFSQSPAARKESGPRA